MMMNMGMCIHMNITQMVTNRGMDMDTNMSMAICMIVARNVHDHEHGHEVKHDGCEKDGPKTS
eukprot:11839382-Alexandrium_andersonii.AAC.1